MVLIEAVRENALNTANHLLLTDYFNINETDLNNKNSLHFAILNNNFEFVKFLIHNHIDYNHQDNDGLSPLHTAVLCDNYKIVKFLLSLENIKVNLLTNTGASALLIATHQNCDSRIIKLLLDSDANVNLYDNNNNTPLSWAVYHDNIETTELLLDAKARIGVKNMNGKSEEDYIESSVISELINRYTTSTSSSENDSSEIDSSIDESSTYESSTTDSEEENDDPEHDHSKIFKILLFIIMATAVCIQLTQLVHI